MAVKGLKVNSLNMSDDVPGLVLLNTTSFSGVASVSLPASTFTSTYKDYRIIFTVTSVSINNSVQLRLRASGTDDTSANYDTELTGGTGNTAFATATNDGTNFAISGAARDVAHNFVLDIINPQATAMTFISGTWFNTNSGSSLDAGNVNGRFQLTTAFDSASFTTGNGTLTGNYSVYAYAK